jgi:hypothetical protein
MNRRAEILKELVEFEKPTGSLLNELREYGWAWSEEKPLIIIGKDDLLRIIDRFLTGSITAEQLQEWAENLECREDVAFDKNNESLLDDVFFRLAPPFINEPLNESTVRGMRAELLKSNGC